MRFGPPHARGEYRRDSFGNVHIILLSQPTQQYRDQNHAKPERRRYPPTSYRPICRSVHEAMILTHCERGTVHRELLERMRFISIRPKGGISGADNAANHRR